MKSIWQLSVKAQIQNCVKILSVVSEMNMQTDALMDGHTLCKEHIKGIMHIFHRKWNRLSL